MRLHSEYHIHPLIWISSQDKGQHYPSTALQQQQNLTVCISATSDPEDPVCPRTDFCPLKLRSKVILLILAE